jgi:hypothetical protein
VPANAAAHLWTRVRRQFDAQAQHHLRIFFPQEDAVPLAPNDSYVRIWLSELFLAKQVAWGTERTPAVHASVRLLYGGMSPQTFVTLAQPPAPSSSGVFEDYQLTELLPYRGASIELQASLYEILGKNNLRTAVDILTGFASLVTPPVSTALSIADMVASGVEKVIDANAAAPALVLQGTLAAPGAGLTNELQPGWLAVVSATEYDLSASELHIVDGRLCLGDRRLTGFDYLVLRIEGRAQRVDWRAPDLDQAISAAAYARALGRKEEYERLRADALSKIYFSPDFTPGQRNQVAQSVKEELDGMQPGAASQGELTVADIVARRGVPSRAQVSQLTLAELLST